MTIQKIKTGMQKRIAFFVEGQTEQIFIARLVKEILGSQYTNITLKQYRGGTNAPKTEIVRSCIDSTKKARYEVLISDCGADNRVKSEIMDNMSNLKESNYSMLIGLRDLYPLPMSDYDKLKKGLNYLPNHLRAEQCHFEIVVAVRELETWFIAETNHFRKVDRRLTGRFIKERIGYNPECIDVQTIKHPSLDLNAIYRLVGKNYNKRFWQVSKLVNRLDYNNIRNNLRYKLAPLDQLISILEGVKRYDCKTSQ